MNPIYQALMQNMPANGAAQFIQQAMQFAQGFRGNAQQQVQALMQSGRVSQAQYNAAVQKAQELMKYMK